MRGMDEFALIRLLNRRGSPGTGRPNETGVKTGIGDDAAVMKPSAGSDIVVSCDTMVETVHFLPETMQHYDIGYKAMASSLSDMAAMGARPRWALIALTVPSGPSGTWTAESLQELYDGLYACADRYGTVVVGGDTTSSKSLLTVTVTVIGEADEDRSLLRSSALPGDIVFVTGPLGNSAAGLHLLLKAGRPAVPIEDMEETVRSLVLAHRRPEPRIDAGAILASSEAGVCGALNDISDGLASEAWEIAEASGVRIVLDEERIPLSPELTRYASAAGRDPHDFALYGGEDYELVGTVRRERAAELAARFEVAGKRIWLVGEVAAAGAMNKTDKGAAANLERAPMPGVTLRSSAGVEKPLPKKGYNHFA
ncbi:thiamine-phosphate kinase [Paenibacillus sp. IB182363]|uniref:Thiamine-monophosphate kinase n=2 Tax=Paenibacillus oceani TaxID=2772510 RepID=A0A927CDZ6_9BACL|nr:thiamine-phosphate kinase [Paenibacillus oceani]